MVSPKDQSTTYYREIVVLVNPSHPKYNYSMTIADILIRHLEDTQSGQEGDRARFFIRRIRPELARQVLQVGFELTGFMGLGKQFGEEKKQVVMDVANVRGGKATPAEPFSQTDANELYKVVLNLDFLRLTGTLPDLPDDLVVRR